MSTIAATFGSDAARALGKLDEWTQHLGREVVDDVPAEILESVADRGSPGTRHPGDDQQFLPFAVRGHNAPEFDGGAEWRA